MYVVKSVVIIGALLSLVACSDKAADTGDSVVEVTPENYSRAEVDTTFLHVTRDVGINTFRHDRTLMPLDKQPAVTINRDTIYSLGVFYAPKGTTVTLPKSKDDRYQSAMIMQNDHYIDQVFYGEGTYEIEVATEFTGIVIRTQVDARDPDDIKYVNVLQDQVVVKLPGGVTSPEFNPPTWNMSSLKALRAKYQSEASALPNFNSTSGARGDVDSHMQRLGVSVALGLLPPQDAMYLYRDYGLSGSKCYQATYTAPSFRDKGFFSFTMYGSDKYIHSEESNLNNRVINYNPDGTFTMHYGSKDACGDVANRLGTPGDNWYLGFRIYRAADSIVENGYDMPEPALLMR